MTEPFFHDEVKIVEFAEARAQEILALRESLIKHDRTNTILQLLPRHMRRKAAAYNSKRLPRALQSSGKLVLKQKRQCRRKNKHLKRKEKYLKRFRRRMMNDAWLETHIWHAKRFKMCLKWGFYVPLYSNNKGVKVTYKAASDLCCITDLSYFCCLELSGLKETILKILKPLCLYYNGVESESAYIRLSQCNGKCEGNLLLYRCNAYPYKCLGPVTYIWRSTESELKTLWLWIHPAMYLVVMDEINKRIQDLNLVKQFIDTSIHDENSDNANLQKVTFNSLRKKFSRFRLIGPLALSVLHSCLVPSCVETSDSSWCKGYYNSDTMSAKHKMQIDEWKSLNCVPVDSRIFFLTVRDPRTVFPGRNFSALKKEEFSGKMNQVSQFPSTICHESPIWSEELRKQMRTEAMTSNFNCQILEGKSFLEVSENRENSAAVPVVLIYRAKFDSHMFGSQPGFGSHWDFICPGGWGKHFWQTLVYAGGRAIALQDLHRLALEAGTLIFPDEYPDTCSYKTDAEEIRSSLLKEYSLHPPAKRINFILNKVLAPFHSPWFELCCEWAQKFEKSINDFYVVRCRSSPLESLPPWVLLPVYIVAKNSGTLSRFALIYSSSKACSEKAVTIQANRRKNRLSNKNCATLELLKKSVDDLKIITGQTLIDEGDLGTIGFVTSGGYSFRRGYCVGKGFVIKEALQPKNEKSVTYFCRETKSMYCVKIKKTIMNNDIIKETAVHILPCSVNENESAKVTEYFTSQIFDNPNKAEEIESSFRGRPLNGRCLKIPDGWSGVIYEDFNENNLLENIAGKFSKLTYWNLDKETSYEDSIQKLFVMLRTFHS